MTVELQLVRAVAQRRGIEQNRALLSRAVELGDGHAIDHELPVVDRRGSRVGDLAGELHGTRERRVG